MINPARSLELKYAVLSVPLETLLQFSDTISLLIFIAIDIIMYIIMSQSCLWCLDWKPAFVMYYLGLRELYVYKCTWLLINPPVIPCPLMNTLPLRLNFPFESTDLPRLKIDFHLFDFPENFLLKHKQRFLKPVLSDSLFLRRIQQLWFVLIWHSVCSVVGR